jgi:hypothetical protein
MMHDGEDKYYATRMASRTMNMKHCKKKAREGIVSGQYTIFYWVPIPWWIIMVGLVDFIYNFISSLCC